MIDQDCMIKSLRLAWLQRIYNVTEGPWKWYLSHLLAKFGGLFLFNCNYDVNDLSVPSLFYSQLLKWWSDFREDFASPKDWHNIIWNNRDIRIDGSPVFNKNFFRSGVVYLRDLLLNCNNTESFEIAARNIEKSNFLIWTVLRDSIPSHLKDNTTSRCPSSTMLSFSTGNGDEVLRRSQGITIYYLSVKKPNYLMQSRFFIGISTCQKSNCNKSFCSHIKLLLNLTSERFSIKYLIEYFIQMKSSTKLASFHIKNVLFVKANQKLYHCPFSIAFWKDFEAYWTLAKTEQIHLTLEDIIVGL